MFHSNRGRRRRGVNYSIRRHIHGSLGFTLPLLVAVAALIGLLTATAPAASQDPGARRVGRSLAAGMVQSPVRETQTTLAIESPPTTQATPATGTTVATQTTLAAQTTLPTHLPDRLPIVPPDAMVRLALDPVEASTIPNNPQAFTARVSIVIGPHQEPTAKNPDTFRVGLDVTPFTQFTIEDGSCSRSRVAANCLAASRGTHIVTGTLPANAIPGVPYRLRGQARLQVEPPPDQLLLEPLRATIELGTGQTYTAQGVADGELLPGELTEQARFTFTGRDGTHECQQSTCTPTALGDYSVIGTLVSNPGVRGKALLHVVPPVRLRLEPNPASIELGKSQAYTAQHVAGAGSRLDDVTGQTTFTMTGPDGKTQECPEATCTPAARGDYVVTGTLVSNPDVRGTAMLHVHRPPGRLRLDPRSATIRLGERQRYTAQRAAEDGSWRDVTGQTTFTMTGSDGTHACRGNICTPAVSGDYTVRGSLFDNPDVRGTALLHVPQPPVGLQLEPGEATIELGREQRYTAQGVAANGSLLDDLTGHTSFTMTGPDGTHECRGSTCKPAMRGDYTVTGTLVDDPKVRGTAVLHVHPPRPSRLQLDPSKATIVLGVSQDYTARGIAANGDPLDDVTGQTRFTLTGPDGIHDCQQSTCTPAAAGDYTVTGSLKDDSRVRGTAVLHVLPPLDHLLLRPERATIPLGQSQYYTARGVATDDSLLEDLTDQTTFTLTGPDGTHQCQRTTCTPTAAGNYTVTGTLDSGVQGTADLLVIRPLDHLLLQPDQATIVLGEHQRYTAQGVAEDGGLLEDMTGQTTFTMAGPDGIQKCQQSTCTPTAAGDYTVTGTLRRGGIGGTATLTVLPRQPSLTAVTPDPTLPGKPVEVHGSVGSCDRTATLTFHGMSDVSTAVTADQDGAFVSRFTVPKGTFPRAYSVELVVECRGQLRWVQSELTVINLAPVAVDDSVTTIQDTPVAIAVAANDRNLDPDSGYQTAVIERSSPAHGTIQVRSDRTILYTPQAGFVGRDQFQYGFCDNVINAVGQADCGIATVSVTVKPQAPPTTTTGPPTTNPPPTGQPPTGPPTTNSPPTSLPPTSTSPKCDPSAGHVARFEVTPIKGAGGVRLRITATGDRNLADCPLTVLLGGLPLGPTLQVAPNGSIAAQRSVPNNATPAISTVALAMSGGRILAETPFEITSLVPPPGWARGLLRLLIGAGAFVVGAAAQTAVRRWRAWREERRDSRTLKSMRIEPYTGSASLEVKRTRDRTRTFTVRIEPHPDPGTQTVQEVTG